MTLAEVKTLPINNLRDIPAMLRMVADRIERGEEHIVSLAMVGLHPEEGPILFQFGDELSLAEFIGLLQMGVVKASLND